MSIKLLSLLLLLTLPTPLDTAQRDFVPTYPTFVFANKGVNDFINYVKTRPDQIKNFSSLLTDIENYAKENHINFLTELEEIKNNLHARIQTITSKQNKEIDRENIIKSAGYLGIVLVILCILCLMYKKLYRNRRKEMASIIERLSHDDIHIRETYSAIDAVVGDNTLIISQEHEKMIRRFLRLKKISDGIFILLILGFFAISALTRQGYSHLRLGLNPHYDNQRLITYEILLQKAQSYSQ